MAFRTKYGLYEYLVMLFRLTNAPTSFCHGVVPILRGALLDLGKGPPSVAMATGISMVMLVALATSLSASFVCCLA
jgi:hypothetical protein